MGFYKQFETFDPLEENVPAYPFDNRLPEISRRARRLLSGRTKAEIISAAHAADWFIEQFFETEKEVDAVGRHGATEFFALMNSIDNYDLDDDDEFPNGTHEEYFAVLALWKVADAVSALKPGWMFSIRATAEGLGDPALLAATETAIRSTREVQNLTTQYSIAGTAALEAMEAICWAEHLETIRRHEADFDGAVNARSEQKAKERISLTAKKAAIARHTETRAIKAYVFEWCAENLGDKTIDSAAAEIAGKIANISFRTAQKYITEYRKSIRSAR
jgi:hypothetical protein